MTKTPHLNELPDEKHRNANQDIPSTPQELKAEGYLRIHSENHPNRDISSLLNPKRARNQKTCLHNAADYAFNGDLREKSDMRAKKLKSQPRHGSTARPAYQMTECAQRNSVRTAPEFFQARLESSGISDQRITPFGSDVTPQKCRNLTDRRSTALLGPDETGNSEAEQRHSANERPDKSGSVMMADKAKQGDQHEGNLPQNFCRNVHQIGGDSFRPVQFFALFSSWVHTRHCCTNTNDHSAKLGERQAGSSTVTNKA